MLTLPESLKAWILEKNEPSEKTQGLKHFTQAFKLEVSQLNYQHLPLQQGLSLSSYVSDDKPSAIINRATEDDININVYASIFYTGIIAGCSCSDDPTPQDTQNEYCELHFSINKLTAETVVNLIAN